MNRDQLRKYCLANPGTTAEFPFGPDAEVLKVLGKMFAIIPVQSNALSISLKCDPVRAELLRQTYEAIQPGYHLNKRHWNTITVDGSIPDDDLEELIDHSYDLVVKGLPKTQRERLKHD
jgi:predicted DNA-binding protein (MmcQ/YjbR family)